MATRVMPTRVRTFVSSARVQRYLNGTGAPMAAADKTGGGGVTVLPETATGAKSTLPPSRFHNYLYSGSKKHVFVGLAMVSAITCIPYFMLTSGTKHQNHADYMDAAEKARQSRLSSSHSST